MKKFLLSLLLSSNVFAAENFNVIEGPSGEKVYSASLENDPAYIWSSELYLRNKEGGRSFICEKNEANVKVPAIQSLEKSLRILAVDVPFSNLSLLPQKVKDIAKCTGVLKIFVSIESAPSNRFYISPHRFFFIGDRPKSFVDVQEKKIELAVFARDGKPIDLFGCDRASDASLWKANIAIISEKGKEGAVKNQGVNFVLKNNNIYLDPKMMVPEKTQSMYSWVCGQEEKSEGKIQPGKYAAITFHWLLSKDDYQSMVSLLKNCKNTGDFLTKLQSSPFSNLEDSKNVVTLLKTGT